MKVICPKCGKKEGVKIIYGYPMPSAMKEAEKGEIHLGGCVITIGGSDPQWHCNNCGHEWNKAIPPL